MNVTPPTGPLTGADAAGPLLVSETNPRYEWVEINCWCYAPVDGRAAHAQHRILAMIAD